MSLLQEVSDRFPAARDLVRAVLEFCDDTSFLFLFIVSIASYMVATRLARPDHFRTVHVLSPIVFLAYIAHVADSGTDPFELVAIVIRAVLVANLSIAPMVLLVWLFSLILQFARSSRSRIRRWRIAIAESFRARRERRQQAEEQRRLSELPPPPTYKEILGQNALQAKEEFQHRMELLRESGLDEDELRYAILEARRHYIRRLKSLIQ